MVIASQVAPLDGIDLGASVSEVHGNIQSSVGVLDRQDFAYISLRHFVGSIGYDGLECYGLDPGFFAFGGRVRDRVWKGGRAGVGSLVLSCILNWVPASDVNQGNGVPEAGLMIKGEGYATAQDGRFRNRNWRLEVCHRVGDADGEVG